MKTGFRKKLAGTLAFCMIAATVLAIPFGFLFPASAESASATFSSGAVLIDSSYNGKNVIIKNGVFSVTVVGATNVTLLFEGATMNRRYADDTESGKQIEGLWAVSQKLGWNNKAQVCPLLITGNSEVKVAFRGANYFYAGVNGCTVNSSNYYTKSQSGGGFAGIQVDSGSTLT